MPKIVRYFPDVSMGGGYDALSAHAKRSKVDLSTLDKGEFVVFMNKKKDKMKLCTHSDVVLYHRRKEGINPAIIQYVPEFFDGHSFNYDGALKKVVRNEFPEWFEKETAK